MVVFNLLGIDWVLLSNYDFRGKSNLISQVSCLSESFTKMNLSGNSPVFALNANQRILERQTAPSTVFQKYLPKKKMYM